MIKYFVEHPKSVNETYIEHLFQTIKFSTVFILAAIIVLVHGIFPFIFKTAATEMVIDSLRSARPDLFE